MLQAQGENVLQRINNRVSCHLAFVGPALITLEGLGVRGFWERRGLGRRRRGGKDRGTWKVERMGWR